jgi:hypothetical protein
MGVVQLDEFHLHLGLNHDINKLVFTLSDLNDLFNQASAEPALKIRDTATG